MAVMSRFYPNYELDDQTVELYASMLADIPNDVLEAAAKKIIATSTFFPALAEWHQSALDLIHDKAGIPTPFEAWAEVLREMKRVGSYGEPNFSHPLVLRTVKIFGWIDLCASEQPDYDRAHFVKAYQQLQERGETLLRARLLPQEVRVVTAKYRAAQQVTEIANRLADRIVQDE